MSHAQDFFDIEQWAQYTDWTVEFPDAVTVVFTHKVATIPPRVFRVNNTSEPPTTALQWIRNHSLADIRAAYQQTLAGVRGVDRVDAVGSWEDFLRVRVPPLLPT